MSGIDIIFASLCLNITCDIIQLEKSPAQADWLVKNCIPEQTCNNFKLPTPTEIALNTDERIFKSSLEQKEFALEKIRQKLNGTKLNIITLEDFPLSYKDPNGTGYKGVAFQLLDFLAEKFNFTYDVTEPPQNKFGSTNDMEGSLIEALNSTNADMATAFLPIISDARLYIDYSTTTLDEGEWIMIMKRPSESATGSGLMAPFNRDVWITIFVSLFAVGPIIYGLIIIRNYLTRDNSQKRYSMPNCVWFVYGALMKQGSTLSPSADSTRLIFATWWIFITILTSFYTANLTAFLTLSKFTLPINEVADIVRNNKHFVAPRGSGVEYAIKNPNESLTQLLKMVDNKRGVFSELNDSDSLVRYVQKENYVYIRDRPAINHLIYSDYKYRKTISRDEKVHCPFATAITPFMTRKRAFAYPKNSPWSSLFDPELLYLVESGIVKYKLWEDLPKAPICPQNLGGTERQLRNGDLLMTYQIMLGGFGTGFVIFLTEIIFKFLLHRQNFHAETKDPYKKKVDKLVVPTITPPPSYTTLYNRSRNNNIWTLSETENKNMEGIKHINGRDYMVVNDDNGQKRLIPLRTPSAALFQYSYSK